jgi:hypothetical protein
MLTYTTDDGRYSLAVWNGRDGVIPDVITLGSGLAAQLASFTYEGPGWVPPDGTATIDEVAPLPDPVPGASELALGWPGQPYLNAGS